MYGKKATRSCPCGYLGDPLGRCRCTAEQVQRYRARVSGPLLDRIDLHVEAPRLAREQLLGPPDGESSAAVRQRVSRARARQLTRAGKPNAALRNPEVDQWCALQPEDRQLLSRAIEYLGLSARAYHRVLKVARTIADLSNNAEIRTTHLTEAIGYRRLDRAPPAHG